ncbi:Fc receptor-like protein 5 [Clinocottus analis]|uniref:Fc receptor-like protein 5 n=1 Tax=Clinocottus analis TaxID=304258 RepID=UPI0035C22A8D
MTCSVTSSSPSSSGWKYFWYRGKKTSEPINTEDVALHQNGKIRVSQEGGRGVYWCRGGSGDPVYYSEYSDPVVTNRAVVTLQPDWPEIYSGETITLTCDIQDGGDAEWEYLWRTPGPQNPSGFMIRASHSGDYECRGKLKDENSLTEWSDAFTFKLSIGGPQPVLTVSPSWPSPGGSVALTCSVEHPSAGWSFFWYKGQKTSKPVITREGVLLPNEQIGDSQEGGRGVYWCRGGRGDPVYYSEYSDPVVTNRAVVTLQPDWPEIYSGETITLTCDIQDGGDAEWEYLWRTPRSYRPQNPSGFMIRASHSGDYKCRGKLKDENSFTEWSDAFTFKLSIGGPQPVLTVSPSWPSPGGSVALTCSVEHPSAGWSFFWYQLVPERSDYSYELLPGSTKGTEQDSYIVHGQTHTAGYVCRAARGDPVFYSLYSEPKFIWSGDSGSASLSVSPDRLQHFSKESLSLSCEGNATEWRVRRFSEFGHLTSCSDWGTMTGSTCNMNSNGISGVYWCESETGQFSNAANITIQRGDVILVSSVRPVTEGHPVTLSCKFKTEKILHNVDFYKNGKLIPNHTSGQLFISEVTKSDEGFYKCKGSDSPQSLKSLTSSESWLSVKYAAASSPFPVLLVVGLVCGVSLIILLLLFLYRCRKSKGSRLMRSQSTNQSAATDHMTNQDETQDNTYASPCHSDSCLYETIRGSAEREHDESMLTYSVIELRNIKKERNNESDEIAVYSDVKMPSAAGSSRSAAADETLYSELKPAHDQ